MSTKIFNGYKLAHKNPFQLHADFRAVFKPAWDKAVAEEYIRGAITYADQYYFGDPKTVEEVHEQVKKNNKATFLFLKIKSIFINIITKIDSNLLD